MTEPIFRYNDPVVSHFDTSTERPRRVTPQTAPSFPPPPGPTRQIPREEQHNVQSKTIINLITEHLSFLVNKPKVLTRVQENFMYEIASSFANTLAEKNYTLSDKEVEMGTSDSVITESENYPMFEINNTDEKNESSTDTFSSESCSSDDEFKNETIPLISEYENLRSESCTPDHSDNYSEQLDQVAKLDINFPSGNNWATFESNSTLNDHNNDMDTISMDGTWMDTITAKGTLANSRNIPSNMATTQTELSCNMATTQTELSGNMATTQTELSCNMATTQTEPSSNKATTQTEFSFNNAATQTNNSPSYKQPTKSVEVQTNPINIIPPIEASSPMIHIDNPNLSSDKALEKMCEDFSSMNTSPENAMLTIANKKSDLELRHKPIDQYIDDDIYTSIRSISTSPQPNLAHHIPLNIKTNETLSANEIIKVEQPILLSSKPYQNLEEKKNYIKIQPENECFKRKSRSLEKTTVANEEKLENQQTPKHFFFNAIDSSSVGKEKVTNDAFKKYRISPGSSSSKTDSSNGENKFEDSFIQSNYSQAIGGLTTNKSPLQKPKLNLDGSVNDEGLKKIQAFIANIRKERETSTEHQTLALMNGQECSQIVNESTFESAIFSLETPTVNNSNHSICMLDINSLEEPADSNNEYSLLRLSTDELNQMQSKTNQLNIKQFNKVLKEYRNNRTIVASIKLQLESLKSIKKTPEIEIVLKELEEELIYQKNLENQLELELEKISSRRSDIYPAFTMPDRYGRKGTYDYRRIEGIPTFNPNDKNTRLSHTWAQLKIAAAAPENDWSKECMKSVLYNRLKGEAVDYFYEYRDFPLEELIVILGKRFETHKKKSDFEEEFEKFSRTPKETLLACITRLQYIVRRMLCDNTDAEKLIMEKQFLRVKLKKLVPKPVWQQTLSLENTRLETGNTFDLIHEIQIAEKAYLESHGNSELDLITSLQAMYTTDTKKGPSQKPNTSDPLHTKRMADGTAHVGKGVGGGISKNFRSRSRNRSTPYVSPSNSRSGSRSPSANRSYEKRPDPMDTDSKNAPKDNIQGRRFEGDENRTPNFQRSGTDFNRSRPSYNTRYQRGGRANRFLSNRGRYDNDRRYPQREQSPNYQYQQPQNHYQQPQSQYGNDPQPQHGWRSRDYRQNQPRFFNQGFRGRNRNYGNNVQTFKQEFEVPETFTQTIHFDNICQLSSCRKSNGLVHTKSNCPLNRSHFH